jgi:hypothetical protein
MICRKHKEGVDLSFKANCWDTQILYNVVHHYSTPSANTTVDNDAPNKDFFGDTVKLHAQDIFTRLRLPNGQNVPIFKSAMIQSYMIVR